MDEKKVREAIKVLKITIDIGKQKIEHNKTFEPKNDNEYIEKSIECAKIAIEALEKQLPNKPVESNTFGDNFIYYKCPKCKTIVQIQADYCILCGQQLNWTET